MSQREERQAEVARWEGQFMALLSQRPNPIAPHAASRKEGYDEQRHYNRSHRTAGATPSHEGQRFMVSDVQPTVGILSLVTINAEDVVRLKQGDEVIVTSGVLASDGGPAK